MASRTFRDILNELDGNATSTVEKGAAFERLVKAFLELDKRQADRFDRVWMWADWPGNGGRHDTGIDLVARERNGGDLVAIQCKFYREDHPIDMAQLNKFLTAYGEIQFASGILVATTHKWTRTADRAIQERRSKPVERWGPDAFEQSSIDWATFDPDNPRALVRRPTKEIRPYQQEALDAVIDGLSQEDRGKLIMACGSGKTFTALRIAEQRVGVGGTVLFLTPSISLLSQSLLDWANDADVPLRTFAVCSDTRVGQRPDDADDISPYDLAFPASTDVGKLMERIKRIDRSNCMTAIFCTYQSLDVINEAQQTGLPSFGLVICDEAHRTTGVSLQGKSESSFQRIHDDDVIAAQKRLYMTATPRIYGDRAKRKANESRLTIASMDNEELYGKELHRLGFGRAIELGILSPYKVVIFNVDQDQVALTHNDTLSDSSNQVKLDDVTRMVGCWNGLGKRGSSSSDFSEDPQPAKRAVAFSNRIDASKLFTDYFPKAVEVCIRSGQGVENLLRCEVNHVDGTQNALQRAEHLAWLRADAEEGVCKVLSNARCLTEGIDVPALDAVLFLHPRKSDIDVVQAVGRVMRKAEGKQFGYIILPIAQAPNETAQETVNSSAYRAVWQVINAISAHDDRFEAQINQLSLARDNPSPEPGPNTGEIGIGENGLPVDNGKNSEQTSFIDIIFEGSAELRDAVMAKIVDKYADPGYWEKWAVDVRGIAERHESRIRALLNKPESDARPAFDNFLSGIRHSLNDGVTEGEAIGMLSQHLITKPVLDALFEDYSFVQRNPVSLAMQGTLGVLEECGLEKETEGLENFYRDVRIRVQGITDAIGKQKVIAELYQRFFKLALPQTASRLGIVYTPVEVVDYIIRSVEDVLNREFEVSVSDECVHVLDPFVGTGTFITRLLRSGLIRPEDLKRKYEQEIHANEVMLLAYYVAAINIESTWHDLANQVEYQPFNGIILTDTFQSNEAETPMDEFLFPSNSERIRQQRELNIRVIIGNPPWSATNNRAYPTIDSRVQQRYAALSATKHLSALYDPYVKAIRMASDRIHSQDKGGVVAFVVNGGFIDANAFDGFRKAVVEEFHAVYCFNLRGDARTSGDKRQREGGGVFDQESRAGVAILLLVKKPGESNGATIYYRDIGDYLNREEKLKILADSRLTTTEWQVITPNEHGDWISQRNEAFAAFRPLVSDAPGNDLAPIFKSKTLGLVTARDAWCFNSSLQTLRSNIENSIAYYNDRVRAFQETNPTGKTVDLHEKAKAFVGNTPEHFHWDAKNHRHLATGRNYEVDNAGFRIGSYRPFFKQRLYFNPEMNNSIRDFPNLYPSPDVEIRGINFTREGASAQFHALMTDAIPDLHLTGDTTHLPSHIYTPPPPPQLV